MTDRTPQNDSDPRLKARADAQVALLRERFGARYSEAQWEAISRQLLDSAGKSAALRTVPLTNGDEPEILFAPARRTGGGA
jgi:hypothetical protein